MRFAACLGAWALRRARLDRRERLKGPCHGLMLPGERKPRGTDASVPLENPVVQRASAGREERRHGVGVPGAGEEGGSGRNLRGVERCGGDHESGTSAGAAVACLAVAVISARDAVCTAGWGLRASAAGGGGAALPNPFGIAPSDDLPGFSPPFGSDHCYQDRQESENL